MTTGIEYALTKQAGKDNPRSIADTDKSALPVPAKAAPVLPAPFWQSFLRVETDKVILLLLIILLHHWHMDEKITATAVGGLIMAIQQQRFKW